MGEIVNRLQQIRLAGSVASGNVVETLMRPKLEFPVVPEISEREAGEAQGIFSGVNASDLQINI